MGNSSTSTDLKLVVSLAAVLSILLLSGMSGVHSQHQQPQPQLRVGFYSATCPSAEATALTTMSLHVARDRKVAGHILRLQFHDCAATGCDASVLLEGPKSERAAAPNLSLEGFDIIADIKANLEARCPGIVSCADIITMAARDAVFLTGGPRFSVPLGRFDSQSSGGINVNLPSPSTSVPAAIAFFQGIGLTAEDMVVLLGAHTIGFTHCSSFSDRLFNFNNTSVADPSLDPTLLSQLRVTCSNAAQAGSTANNTVALDFESESNFDNHYYKEVRKGHGVLQIDQALFAHRETSHVVDLMVANATLFSHSFALAMIKMGQIGVKDSTTGLIRSPKCF